MMGKARKRRRLLRVAIVSGLLVVALPSVATGHEHLTPIDARDRGRQAGVDRAWENLVEPLSKRADYYSRLYKECSTDLRDPRLMNPGARMCHYDQEVIANEVPTGQERAYAQHLVPEVGASIDQVPAPSDRTGIEAWWGIVGLVVAAGGAAGLIVGLRRGRPHALS
jgi:hypothetical protein